jgi:hypothetical protein
MGAMDVVIKLLYAIREVKTDLIDTRKRSSPIVAASINCGYLAYRLHTLRLLLLMF